MGAAMGAGQGAWPWSSTSHEGHSLEGRTHFSIGRAVSDGDVQGGEQEPKQGLVEANVSAAARIQGAEMMGKTGPKSGVEHSNDLRVAAEHSNDEMKKGAGHSMTARDSAEESSSSSSFVSFSISEMAQVAQTRLGTRTTYTHT